MCPPKKVKAPREEVTIALVQCADRAGNLHWRPVADDEEKE